MNEDKDNQDSVAEAAETESYLEKTKRISKTVKKLNSYYEEERGKGIFLIGSPYSLTLNGEISSEICGRLAAGVESNLKAELSVLDFLEKITETQQIDLNDISGVTITMTPGDVVQAIINTYKGDSIVCALSSIKITLNDSKATDFTLSQFKELKEDYQKEKVKT